MTSLSSRGCGAACPKHCVPRAEGRSARNVLPTGHSSRGRRVALFRGASDKDNVGPTENTGAGLKAVWYAAEAFGKLVGGNNAAAAPASKASVKLSRDEAVAEIKRDYEQNYFVSGAGEMAAYAPDCVFADPFVSFRGVARFKQNVSNLGRFMQDIKIDVYDFNVADSEVDTKWRFSCVLDLPWKPRLAAAGSTTHRLDLETGQVVQHIERWDVEPGKVVKQLFTPASKLPTNRWEAFFMAASDGDGSGVWFAVTPLLIRATLPVIGLSLGCKLITGEGLPGVFLGTVEGLSYLGFVAAIVTEVLKFAQGMQGGDTGTGGRF